MAVGLRAPDAGALRPVAGCELGWTQAGIRKVGRKDLLLIRLAAGTSVAGVFTRNRFCAAPVQVCRTHLAGGLPIRALLINSGCANAGTGAAGLADALRTCEAAAALLQCEPAQVLPFSTGVIMEPLPVQAIVERFESGDCVLASDDGFTGTLQTFATRVVEDVVQVALVAPGDAG